MRLNHHQQESKSYRDCLNTIPRAISSREGRLGAALLCLAVVLITKVSSTDLQHQQLHLLQQQVEERERRKNCQIIYIVGVEGAMHHGFSPILESLAHHQVDPNTGMPYDVRFQDRTLRSALFGFRESRSVDDPTLVTEVLKHVCPNDGKKHVIIEDSSFPCGMEDDPRSYRVHRQPEWKTSSMEQIANSEMALNHPTNLYSFYNAYSPYADIKFVVLHRPFLETIASHHDWDDSLVMHSNVIRGFMLLLSRFLDVHPIDTTTGKQLWTLVCIEIIMSKH